MFKKSRGVKGTVMIKQMGWLLLAGWFGMALGCESGPKKADSNKQASWSESMQGLSKEVKDILPFVYSRQTSYSAKEVADVRKNLQSFSKVAHKISPKMGQPFLGDDPMVTFSLEKMGQDVSRADNALAMGQVRYSKGVMKTVMGHCFRCHSVTDVGSEAHWQVGNFTGLSLSPLEKAELLVATRKYEEAKKLLESSLMNTDYIQNQPFDYEAALKRYLVLTVRLKPDPERASATFRKILDLKAVPYYLSQKMEQWEKSLEYWSNDKRKVSPSLNEAKKMVRKARSSQSFEKDHVADVEFLRATSMLHNLLLVKSPSTTKAQVYYMLGEVYEVLDELGYWGLHETYYESCIRETPNTKVSSRCFQRLQESVYLGYSGSSGVHIPPEELARLKSLRAIALPRK